MDESPFIHMSDDQIPPWDVVEAGLAKLESLLSSSCSADEVATTLADIPLSNFQFIRHKSDILKSIFRARQPKAHEDINLVSTFSLPPAQYTPTGRANREGYPVFYASLQVDTAIQETLPPDADLSSHGIIFVGEWRATSSTNIKQFLHPRQALKNDVMGDYHYGLLESLREILKEYSPKNQITIERLAGRIGDHFLKAEDYRVSSLLGHDAIYGFKPPGGYHVEAIAYPSIVKDHAAINFAIAPDYVSKHLELVEVRKYRVKEATMDGSQVELLALGKPTGETVDWFEAQMDLLQRKSSKFEGSPDAGLKYEEANITIDGQEVELSRLFDEVWNHEKERAMDHAKQEVMKSPLNDETRTMVITTAAKDREFNYEGKRLNEARFSLLVEYRLRLNRMLGKH